MSFHHAAAASAYSLSRLDQAEACEISPPSPAHITTVETATCTKAQYQQALNLQCDYAIQRRC